VSKNDASEPESGAGGKRKTADVLETGEVLKKNLHGMGHGDTAPRAPQADVAIDLVVDGDGDVLSHGFLLGPQ
jgi:hypothetical protein